MLEGWDIGYMETNKKSKRVKYIFLIFSIVLVWFFYYCYDLIKDMYEVQTYEFINIMKGLYPEIDIPTSLLDSSFQFVIPSGVWVFVGVLVLTLLWMYYYISSYHRAYKKDIQHIIEQMDNDEFVPSSLEGDLAVLEEKIYAYKKKSFQLAENNEKEKKQLSDYIENMAHQIKTPIATIRLNEEMSEVTHDLSLLEKNKVSFERLDSLFDNFMKLSRLENETIRIELEEGTVKELFDEVLEQVSPMMKDVKIEFEDCDVHFHYDLEWLSEAVYNIIKNDIEEGVSEIQVSSYYNQEFLHILIHDNGKGIDEVDLPYIFNRFYRSQKNKKKGIGIGLSLCKEIVEKHHGFITAYNDQGAVFDLAFPYLDIKEKVI